MSAGEAAGGRPASEDVFVSVLVPLRNEAATILRELPEDDARIRVLDNSDSGLAPALNLGLCATHGRFIARLDAHALYPPCHVSAGVRRLQTGDVDWVSGPQLAQGTDIWQQPRSQLPPPAVPLAAAGRRAASAVDTTASHSLCNPIELL